jgi:hypothetical protein
LDSEALNHLLYGSLGFVSIRFRDNPLSRDWNHLNESGYRVLGTYLARQIAAPASDHCDDRWDAPKESALLPESR